MNKVRSLIVMVWLVWGLTACASNAMLDVYDDNLKIASDSNTYSLVNYEQIIEGHNCRATIEKFGGMDTVWTYHAAKDEMAELTYLISVYSGKMKLVLIAPDNSLTTIAEITPESKQEDFQTYMLNLKEGENRIKIVGEDTKLDIELSIPIGEFLELG